MHLGRNTLQAEGRAGCAWTTRNSKEASVSQRKPGAEEKRGWAVRGHGVSEAGPWEDLDVSSDLLLEGHVGGAT